MREGKKHKTMNTVTPKYRSTDGQLEPGFSLRNKKPYHASSAVYPSSMHRVGVVKPSDEYNPKEKEIKEEEISERLRYPGGGQRSVRGDREPTALGSGPRRR